jgi:3-oxoacyl-[acyl-carrier protein] reductase
VDPGLRDRVYLVTGGSRGLGFAAAEVLLADGARVVISAPRESTASAAAARLSQTAVTAGAVTWVVADNADPGTPDRLIAAAKDRFGRLDGALISVGGTPPGSIRSTPDDDWRSAFESVFLGAVRLARVIAADAMSETTKDLPANSSITGTGHSLLLVLASSVRVPLAQLPISNGLFPGLAGVVKTLANEVGPDGVRVNALLPVRDRHRPSPRVRRPERRSRPGSRARVAAHPTAPIRGARGVRAGCRVPALARRLIHHRRHDPGRRGRHPLDLTRMTPRPRPSPNRRPAQPTTINRAISPCPPSTNYGLPRRRRPGRSSLLLWVRDRPDQQSAPGVLGRRRCRSGCGCRPPHPSINSALCPLRRWLLDPGGSGSRLCRPAGSGAGQLK